jgi:hypothetical protein
VKAVKKDMQEAEEIAASGLKGKESVIGELH